VAMGEDSADNRHGARPQPSNPAPALARAGTNEIAAEYIRRVYANTREWYAVAETKAQLLLTVNGVFVTVIVGVLFGRIEVIGKGTAHFGPEIWVFLTTCVAALVCALVCAAACLWSWHGRVGREFTSLGVDPDDPVSYRPEVLWYFGHLARLRADTTVERLRAADREFEAETLSYNVVNLAGRVLRKHRLVNAGWAFTALALIALIGAGTSFFIRAQL
jgi:hypothetical protein